jgi:small GTP-binding protein
MILKDNQYWISSKANSKSNWLNACIIGHPKSGKTTLFNYMMNKPYYSKYHKSYEYSSVQEKLTSLVTLKEINLMLIDTPGRTKYTKNIVNGLCVSQVALVVISCMDIINTNWLSDLIHMAKNLKIDSFIGIVSKMDIVNFDEKYFEKAKYVLLEIFDNIGIDWSIIPIIPTAFCLKKEKVYNIDNQSSKMLWAKMTLYSALSKLSISNNMSFLPLRAHVREHNRQVVGKGDILKVYIRQGRLYVGDNILLFPFNIHARILSIWLQDKSRNLGDTEMNAEVQYAEAPMLVSIELRLQIRHYHSKGCIIHEVSHSPKIAYKLLIDLITFPFNKKHFDINRFSKGMEFCVELPTARVQAVLQNVLWFHHDFLNNENEKKVYKLQFSNGVRIRMFLNLLKPIPVDTIMTQGLLLPVILRNRSGYIGGGTVIDINGYNFLEYLKELKQIALRSEYIGNLLKKYMFAVFSSYLELTCDYMHPILIGTPYLMVINNTSIGAWKEFGHSILIDCSSTLSPLHENHMTEFEDKMSTIGATGGIIIFLNILTQNDQYKIDRFAEKSFQSGRPVLIMIEEDIEKVTLGICLSKIALLMRRRSVDNLNNN